MKPYLIFLLQAKIQLVLSLITAKRKSNSFVFRKQKQGIFPLSLKSFTVSA